jgi:hypothetical protein
MELSNNCIFLPIASLFYIYNYASSGEEECYEKVLLSFFIFFTISLHAQKFEELAFTPPMGWNSWNTFEVKID